MREATSRRRVMGTAVAVAALVALAAAVPGPAGAQTAANPGRGQAIAQAFKLDPRAASLSIGITFGMALAGHQNTVATAESRSIDLGIIGDLLAAEGCDGGEPTWPEEDQPHALRTDSNEEGSAQGKSETEYGVVAKTVRATDAPFGEARTRYNELEIPGLVSVANTRAIATSGVVEKGREAVAVTELGSLILAGGLVELNGLRWEARHSDFGGAAGSFSIGGASIAGQAVSLPAGDTSAAMEAINTALAPLGLALTAPTVREASGIVFVEPLVLGVVPSETRDGLVNTLLGAVQPQREQLVEALLEMDCGNATYVTVLDVILGTVSGAGQLGLELGGVQASTAEIDFSNRLGGLGGSLPPVAPPPSGSLETPRPSTGFTPAVTTPPASPPSAPPPAVAPAPAVVTSASGARGGVLAAIGVAGLAALAAAAEADRRKMRRAQRLVPGASS